MAVAYMEKTLGVVITVRAMFRPKTKPASIVWIAEAWADVQAIGGQRPLASASVSMLTRGGGGTDAALLLLLYELDKDFYRLNEGIQGIA